MLTISRLLLLVLLLTSLPSFAYQPSPELQAILKSQNSKIINTKIIGLVTVIQTSEGIYYIQAQNTLINIDDYAILSGLNLKTQPNYDSLIKKYPNLSIWPGNHQFPDSKIINGDITQLIFTYSLLNGCQSCELGGTALVGFNIDPQGNYLGAVLIGLKPSSLL